MPAEPRYASTKPGLGNEGLPSNGNLGFWLKDGGGGQKGKWEKEQVGQMAPGWI